MALWRLEKMEVPPQDALSIDCLEGQTPSKAYLRDQETGLTQTLQFCAGGTGNICLDVFDLLRGAGFTPAEWDTECPPL